MLTPGTTRLDRRHEAAAETRRSILEAGRAALLVDGAAALSTRRVADRADVPLSQIHYHFGSRQGLILALLAAENERLLERQRGMFDGPEPLWVRWDRACDFLETDLASGYVRVLQEMIAAGWSDTVVAASVRDLLDGWFGVLADVARAEAARGTDLGPFDADEMAALMGLPFLGAESLILLGVDETALPIRSALRKVGRLLASMTSGAALEPRGAVD